ncbi:MAG: ABC transporter permease, partial [Eubacterium sp.]|nr:ABC transporter permease [Eubacterium sp.]
LCIVLFIISCITLGISYYFVTAGLKHLNGQNDLAIIIVMGAASTFFIFWSLSGMMMGIFRKMKGVYYKKMNSFILRQFSSKANTMVISMTIVNLMLFFTIVALGSAISLTRNLNENVRKMLPCDVGFVKDFGMSREDFDKAVAEWGNDQSDKDAIYNDTKVDIMSTFKANGFDTGVLKDVLDVYEYSYDGLTLKSFAGEKLGDVTQDYAFIHEDADVTILRQSDYNKIADLFGNEKVDLKDDEYVVVADFDPLFDVINGVLEEGKTIDINGHVLKPQRKEYLFGVDAFESGHTNTGFFVVSDDVVDDSMRAIDILFANYAAGSKEEKQQIEEQVKEFSEAVWAKKSLLMATTKEEIRSSSIGLAVMASFVSLYVGIIFLIASAAVLSLKELSESADNIEKFAMLRKIGVDEKMINSTLFKQIGLFFLFPMVLACIHSIFGLKFANRMFEIFGTTGLGGSICITAIIIVALYGGYFLLTYFSSKRIIRDVTRR